MKFSGNALQQDKSILLYILLNVFFFASSIWEKVFGRVNKFRFVQTYAACSCQIWTERSTMWINHKVATWLLWWKYLNCIVRYWTSDICIGIGSGKSESVHTYEAVEENITDLSLGWKFTIYQDDNISTQPELPWNHLEQSKLPIINQTWTWNLPLTVWSIQCDWTV